MRNREFIQAYIKGNKTIGANNHLGFKNDKLWNYSTVICIIDRENKTAQVNSRKYSNTTSRIQTELRYQLSVAGYEVTEFEGPNASWWNLGYQGAPNVTIEDVRSMS